MEEKIFHISGLIQKKLHGNIAADEERELDEWINSTAACKKVYEQLGVILSEKNNLLINKNFNFH